MNDNRLMQRAADNIRILAAAMVEKAKSGHPGGAMGGADFINVLYSEFLQFDPSQPTWMGRDRFFLDPGHMAPMLYAELALIGKFSLGELQQLRQWDSRSMRRARHRELQRSARTRPRLCRRSSHRRQVHPSTDRQSNLQEGNHLRLYQRRRHTGRSQPRRSPHRWKPRPRQSHHVL